MNQNVFYLLLVAYLLGVVVAFFVAAIDNDRSVHHRWDLIEIVFSWFVPVIILLRLAQCAWEKKFPEGVLTLKKKNIKKG